MTAPTIYCNECGASNTLQATHCFACNNALHALANLPPVSAQTQAVSTNAVVQANKTIGPLVASYLLQSRYSIVGQIGTGGFGAVYQAKDTLFSHRLVAIKEMSQDGLSTRELVEATAAFEREALLLADLIHPNLPRIYDYFVENQRWYFVMDFLVGETLAAYLKQRKYLPLPVEEVVAIGIQLTTVLDYLQVHRLGFNDLTLNTIWRTPDGKLYLLDIGATAPATTTPRSNPIYSLGMLLRQLQTGKIPTRSRLQLAPPKLRHPAKLMQPEPLKVLIEQMVHKNVLKRPYSLGLVKQELQHLMTQYNAPKKRGFSRRSLLKMGGNLAGLASLAVASSWVTWQVEFSSQKQIPMTSYSPRLGGTISTYTAQSAVLAVAWSPDGTRLAMGNWSGQIQAWDAQTGHNVINFPGAGFQKVFSLIWLPNGNSIVAGGDNAVVRVWNAATWNQQYKYQGHTAGVITIACSPDSKYIASGGYDQTVQVWDAITGHTMFTYYGHSIAVQDLAWSPNTSTIASAADNVQLWDGLTGKHIYTYTKHSTSITRQVQAVAWSPNGRYIASGGMEGTVQVWNAV